MYSLYKGVYAIELEPSEFSVGQNYPNPFKEKTVIKYCVAYKTRVQITVHNSEGKLIEKLVDEEKKPGTYEIKFNAYGLPDSVYIYQFQAGIFLETKKMILLR